MATYTVTLSDEAKKQLTVLPRKDQERITAALLELQLTPRPTGSKKLKGEYAGLYRIRVGNYRAVYSVKDKELWVLVVWVGQRGGAYK